MNISEAMITIINGCVYEFFMVLSMYFVFETMLHIEKGKKTIFFIIFFISMFAANIPQLYLSYHGQSVKYNELLSLVLASTNTIIYIVALKILTKSDYLCIFLVDIIAAFIGTFIVFSVYGGIAGIIGEARNRFLSPPLSFVKIAALMIALTLMSGLIILERVLLKKYMADFYQKQIRRKGLWWIIVLGFNVSGAIVTALYNGDILFFITSIVLIGSGILILYEVSWWVRRRKEKQIKRENQILSIENAVMKEYYDTLDYQLERTRKFRHDIEKHMSVLKEMITSSGNGKEMVDYAAQIEEEYNYLQAIDYCGNPVVNAILVNKKHQCEEQNITLEIEIGQFETGEIKEIDLIAVISNLLDNAVEECQCIRKVSAKKIVFRCGNRASNLFLSVSNTTDKEETDIKKTWKEDTYVHGVGLSIVREIVEKYDGMFRMEIKDGMCEVMVGLTTI